MGSAPGEAPAAGPSWPHHTPLRAFELVPSTMVYTDKSIFKIEEEEGNLSFLLLVPIPKGCVTQR